MGKMIAFDRSIDPFSKRKELSEKPLPSSQKYFVHL